MKKKNWKYDEQETRLGDPLVADQYHFRQARTIFQEGDHERFAVHDYFIRKPPFGSYLLVNGTERVIKNLLNFRFTEKDIEGVKLIDPLSAAPDAEDYLEYLWKLKFTGDIWAIREGDLAFPNEPIVRVEGNWLETWIIESMILKSMNYASLVATYVSKVVASARGRPVADFGLRRSPGDGAGVISTRAAFIGGMKSTSNVRAAVNLGIKTSGTMSHEFVQGYSALTGLETNAFVIFGRHNPDNFILLVDTFDAIQGSKNAIRAVEDLGMPAEALRIDSGNLAVLAKEIRKLDDKCVKFRKIIETSDLTFELIDSILNDDSPVDGFGVGTKMTAPSNPSALNGVYKLAAIEGEIGERCERSKLYKRLIPTLKISGDIEKTTLPGVKNIWRMRKNGKFRGDIIALQEEESPGSDYEFVLEHAIKDGKPLVKPYDLSYIQNFAAENVSRLAEVYLRSNGPDAVYPVVMSEKLAGLRKELIDMKRW